MKEDAGRGAPGGEPGLSPGESSGTKAKHKDEGQKHNRVGRVRVQHDTREKGRDNRDGHG